MFADYFGDLKLGRSTIEKPLLGITVDLAMSWFPAHATLTWSEPQETYGRITTRPPHYNGNWGSYLLIANCMLSMERSHSEIAPGSRKDHGKSGKMGTRVIANRKAIAAMPRPQFAPRTLIANRNEPRLFAVLLSPRSHLSNPNPAGYGINAVAPWVIGKKKNRRQQFTDLAPPSKRPKRPDGAGTQ